MLPDGVLSTLSDTSAISVPVRQPRELLLDYEMGGVGISDPSQGLRVKNWTLKLVTDKDTGVQSFVLSASGVSDTVLFTSAGGVTEVALSFDQNMKPAVAYVENGQGKLWWYDATLGAVTTILLPAGATTPRMCLDDHRLNQTGISDICLFYISGGNLCARYQRERFTVEHVLRAVGAGTQLISVAMNDRFRLQFRFGNFTGVTDGQTKVLSSPYLGDVVLDLCKRAGIKPTNIDVSELYDDVVAGYTLSDDDTIATFLDPLSKAYFFDPTEFDKKLHFFKRGRDIVMSVSYLDLVDNGDKEPLMKLTRKQEDKLHRKLNLTHVDPAGGYAENKQYAARKSNIVKTKAEETVDSKLVMTANDAAASVATMLKAEWHELMGYAWSLPIGFTVLVPGDIFDFFAKDGSVQRIRIETRNEDGDVIKFEGRQDAGKDVYRNKNATGLSLPYPESTTPGLIGATRLEILNIPVLRDQDDELGIYIAFCGNSSAWYGAQILVSTDGGVTYAEAYRSEVPATIGDTLSDLPAVVSGEYPSVQELLVQTNLSLETVARSQLLNNYNRAVVGDEIIQFQTATYQGNNTWLLGGIVRGRYNTQTPDWPTGTRFVLLDSAVAFIQAQKWMLGKEINFKPVSFGLTEDESVPTAYDFLTAYSQWEWAPTHITASRDGSDNVTVDWIPRPRLGVETSPYNSKYFLEYKIQFSDGFSATATGTTYSRAATPAGVTFTICGVNSITGDGEISEAISV